MKKIAFYLVSILGITSLAFIGLVVYGLFASDNDSEIAEAQEEYNVYDHPPSEEEMTIDLRDTIKGKYGHQTVTHQEGQGIDSVVIDKSEYGDVKALIDDMNEIFNGHAVDKVHWDSQFEKEKYFAGSIVVYVNHFISDGNVDDEQALQLKELQEFARKVLNITNEAESTQTVESFKSKIAEIHSTFTN